MRIALIAIGEESLFCNDMVQITKERQLLSSAKGNNVVNPSGLSEWSAVVRRSTTNNAVHEEAKRQSSDEGGISRVAAGCKSPLVCDAPLVVSRKFYTESDCQTELVERMNELLKATPLKYKKSVARAVEGVKQEVECMLNSALSFNNEHPRRAFNSRVADLLSGLKMEIVRDRRELLDLTRETRANLWETVVSNRIKVQVAASGVKKYVDPSGFSRWALQCVTKDVRINGLKQFSSCEDLARKFESASKINAQALENLYSKYGTRVDVARRVVREHEDQIALNNVCSRMQQIANSTANRLLQQKNNNINLMNLFKKKNGGKPKYPRKNKDASKADKEVEAKKDKKLDTRMGFYARAPLTCAMLESERAKKLYDAIVDKVKVNKPFNRPGYLQKMSDNTVSRPGFVFEGEHLFATYKRASSTWCSTQAQSLSNISHWNDEGMRMAHKFDSCAGSFLRKDQCTYGVFCSAFRIDPAVYTSYHFKHTAQTNQNGMWTNDHLMKNISGIGMGAILFESSVKGEVFAIIVEPDAAFLHHERATYNYPVLITVSAAQELKKLGCKISIPSEYKDHMEYDHWMCLNHPVKIADIEGYYQGVEKTELKVKADKKKDLNLNQLSGLVEGKSLKCEEPIAHPNPIPRKGRKNAKPVSDEEEDMSEEPSVFDDIASGLYAKVLAKLPDIKPLASTENVSALPNEMVQRLNVWMRNSASLFASYTEAIELVFDFTLRRINNQDRLKAAKAVVVDVVRDTLGSTLDKINRLSPPINSIRERITTNSWFQRVKDKVNNVKTKYINEVEQILEAKKSQGKAKKIDDRLEDNDSDAVSSVELEDVESIDWDALEQSHKTDAELMDKGKRPLAEEDLSWQPMYDEETPLDEATSSWHTKANGSRIGRFMERIDDFMLNGDLKYCNQLRSSLWCIFTHPIRGFCLYVEEKFHNLKGYKPDYNAFRLGVERWARHRTLVNSTTTIALGASMAYFLQLRRGKKKKKPMPKPAATPPPPLPTLPKRLWNKLRDSAASIKAPTFDLPYTNKIRSVSNAFLTSVKTVKNTITGAPSKIKEGIKNKFNNLLDYVINAAKERVKAKIDATIEGFFVEGTYLGYLKRIKDSDLNSFEKCYYTILSPLTHLVNKLTTVRSKTRRTYNYVMGLPVRMCKRCVRTCRETAWKRFFTKANGSFKFLESDPLNATDFPLVPRVVNGVTLHMPFVGPSLKNCIYVPILDTVVVYHTEIRYDNNRYILSIMVNGDGYSKNYGDLPDYILPWIVDGDHTVYAHRAIVNAYGRHVLKQAPPPFHILTIDKPDRLKRTNFRVQLPNEFSGMYSKMTGSTIDVAVYATQIKQYLTQAPTSEWIQYVQTGDTMFITAFADALNLDLQARSPSIINEGNSETDNVYVVYKKLYETKDYRKISASLLYAFLILTRSRELTIDKIMRMYYFLTKDCSSNADGLAAFSLAYENCTITSESSEMFVEFFKQHLLKNIGLAMIDTFCTLTNSFAPMFNFESWVDMYQKMYPAFNGLIGGVGVQSPLIKALSCASVTAALQYQPLVVYANVALAVARYVKKVQFVTRMVSWGAMWRSDFTSQTNRNSTVNTITRIRESLLPTRPLLPLPITGYVVNDCQIQIGM